MSGPRPAMGWGLGHYERTAEQLLPAAEALIDAAAPREEERAVDVGCGTGNAALLAAERGATVTGIDPAERLLEVSAAVRLARAGEAGGPALAARLHPRTPGARNRLYRDLAAAVCRK